MQHMFINGGMRHMGSVAETLLIPAEPLDFGVAEAGVPLGAAVGLH